MTTIEATVTAQYNITIEQLDKASRIIDMKRHKIFYQVSSQSGPDTYHVEFSDAHKVLTCNCKAGQNGLPKCWHRRAALAAERIYRAEREQERKAIEQTAEYTIEQAIVDAEQALDRLDEIAARHEAKAERKLEQETREALPLNGNRPFSLLK